MRLAIKTCTLDMPFPDMLDFCCTHHVSAVEIGTGNWSNAPHIDLEALVTSNSARIKWHDEIRRRGLSPVSYTHLADLIAAAGLSPLCHGISPFPKISVMKVSITWAACRCISSVTLA